MQLKRYKSWAPCSSLFVRPNVKPQIVWYRWATLPASPSVSKSDSYVVPIIYSQGQLRSTMSFGLRRSREGSISCKLGKGTLLQASRSTLFCWCHRNKTLSVWRSQSCCIVLAGERLWRHLSFQSLCEMDTPRGEGNYLVNDAHISDILWPLSRHFYARLTGRLWLSSPSTSLHLTWIAATLS